MNEIEPKNKAQILPLSRLEYDVVESILLDGFDDVESPLFFQILESRKSRRSCRELDLFSLGKLFFLSARVKSSELNETGLQIQKRNVPSAGALHSIDCFVSKIGSPDWYVYNPYKHSFDRLSLNEPDLIEAHKQECFNFLPGMQAGYLIWYVCDIERLKSKYENPESLMYRDSGVLSGIQSLIAEALGLPFCLVGRLGYEEASKLSDKRDLIGAGAAIVGGGFG